MLPPLGLSAAALVAALATSALAFVDPLANIPDPATQLPVPQGKPVCAAQNILDNCLSQQRTVFSMCSYADWGCKCSAQKAIAGCFNNCPMDEAKPSHEGQIIVFCNAAMREEEQKSKSSAKNDAKPTASASSAKPAASAQNDADEIDDAGTGGRHRHNKNGGAQWKKKNGSSFKAGSSGDSGAFDSAASVSGVSLLSCAAAIAAALASGIY
ncbi:hypothetical protein H4217_000173 [Coemansia sp. RSA 1939]|nr:hypothetical protein H4217_000173 [Coemansia sp. RSA 1939]KAJ2614387.1 hypothetical protein EV177_002094 [Coemansia sp. RSA 1804]KAJ2695260.1 hypothetical protein GGH99_000238 [Coemansia sp. RSA 1285]